MKTYTIEKNKIKIELKGCYINEMKAEKTEFVILECNKGVTLSEPSLKPTDHVLHSQNQKPLVTSKTF